ncbi:MAG: hypothetical protein Q7V58_06715 [Actinomycetota bacterium]|nr:hypothetical protein [Actinomycetota bacterium]
MFFFFGFWITLLVGLAIHVLVDRHPNHRTGPRFIELALLWVMVWGGIYGLYGVLGHTGPMSAEVAESIGYAPSMFQWEVGFGDLALSVLGIMCLRYRDRWLTAAVVAVAVSFGGDAIGHIMEMSDGNMAVNNVWAMPSDIAQAAAGIVLLVLYRRGLGRLPALPKHGVVGTGSAT